MPKMPQSIPVGRNIGAELPFSEVGGVDMEAICSGMFRYHKETAESVDASVSSEMRLQ